MKIRLASRKSDLARIQTLTVGNELKKKFPNIEIQYVFRESLGDINQSDPLWKMPEKGVFTSDLSEGLTHDKWDAVVHSWKDLPTEMHPQTEIIATLKREDLRDLLLMPKSRIPISKDSVSGSLPEFKVLSSSPRREYNLTPLLPKILPFSFEKLAFLPVRGNVQTRIKKLLQGDGDALIVAKAAIDRILTDHTFLGTDEFEASRLFILDAISNCHFCVLPLSKNPTAAAQGALAIEISKKRSDLKEIFCALNHLQSFNEVQKEREILKSYGGGCHQKIGISVLTHSKSARQLIFARGAPNDKPNFEMASSLSGSSTVAPAGSPTDSQSNSPGPNSLAADRKANILWSTKLKNIELFNRKLFSESELRIPSEKSCGFYFTHPKGIPRPLIDHIKSNDVLVWTSGLETWYQLAKQNVWVCGSDESFGEFEPQVKNLLPRSSSNEENPRLIWKLVTHEDVLNFNSEMPHSSEPWYQIFPAYTLEPKINSPELNNVTHIYWRSYSQFQLMKDKHPHLLDPKSEIHHSCGLGKTYELILRDLKDSNRLTQFLNESEWRTHFGNK